MPPALTVQRKPQLAAAMLHALRQEGLLPFKDVGADCLDGTRPECLDAVDAWVGVTTFVAMPGETRGWLQRPRTEDKTSREKGQERATQRVGDAAPPACPVATMAANRPASNWERRQVSEGSKGPSESALARQRVTLGKEGRPERTVGLVITRTRGPIPAYAYSIRHAPVRTPWRTFVWLSGVRWAIAPCFEAGQTALGMAH